MIDGVLGGRSAGEYAEGAFLYFLDVERLRANRSGYSLRLLLASVESAAGRPVPLKRATTARLFSGLRASLRETDVIGWYRQGRVAGAVLAARTDASTPDVSGVIRERVDADLRRRLRSADSRALRVRVVELLSPRS